MSHGDPAKWSMPGWRIEQRFSPGVLIGNWGEERYNFQKGDNKHNSTYRIDFMNFKTHRPDVVIRRKAQLQSDGLPPEQLFHHHGKLYSNNMISWYDEHYNKRERSEKDKLPDLRQWNSHCLAWIPEKTDYPIQGAPTNFGLRNKIQQDWCEQIANETHGDYNTTYKVSYDTLPPNSQARVRYATPKAQSTTLHKFNKVNKDLSLRGNEFLQSPEVLPDETKPPGDSVAPAPVAVQQATISC